MPYFKKYLKKIFWSTLPTTVDKKLILREPHPLLRNRRNLKAYLCPEIWGRPSDLHSLTALAYGHWVYFQTAVLIPLCDRPRHLSPGQSLRPRSLSRPTVHSPCIPWPFQNSRTSSPLSPFPGLRFWTMPLCFKALPSLSLPSSFPLHPYPWKRSKFISLGAKPSK